MAVMNSQLAILARQEVTESQSFTVTIACELGNEYDGRLGLRISAIFVIFAGSFFGCIIPLLLSRYSIKYAFDRLLFAAAYFGAGVIIATAFIHLLAPSVAALYSPCLDPDSPITQYAWPEGICLMSVFAMFFAELVVKHYTTKTEDRAVLPVAAESVPKQPPSNNVSPQSRWDHRNNFGAEGDVSSFTNDMISLAILEFGIIFHSVLIGLTLAVAGEEFVVLYVVLSLHQTFEGLGLSSRLARIQWPRGKAWLPYALSFAYSLSTPISIAIGLGVRQSFEPGSQTALVASGVFDAISAGILLYVGLVELVAREFFHSTPVVGKGADKTFGAFACMSLGAGLMALLGKWA